MSYIMTDIVSYCEKNPDVKNHSRPQAVQLLRPVLRELEQHRDLFLKYSDLQDEIRVLDADIVRVRRLIDWLEN